MKPLISIIVPIYNVEKYLDKCLETIVNQTYKNLEIILVDDGSLDTCPEKCDQWSNKDSRIIVIHKENAGLGFARNSGLDVATGKYVVFIDSDDYIDYKMIETLYDHMGSADVTYCGLNRVYLDGKIEQIESLYDDETFEQPEIIDKVLLRMLGNKPENDNGKLFYMSVWHALYSIDIIKQNTIRFPSEREFMSEDIAFHIDFLCNATKVRCISDNLYYYRYNPNSLSIRKEDDRFKRIKKLHRQVLKKMSSYMAEERYIQYERCRFLSVSRGQIVNTVMSREKHPIKNIQKIIKDPMVQDEIKKYPYHKNPVKRRVFNFLIDKKLSLFIYIAVKYFMK